jgi:mRNA-degrading endonuclease RelE of RelBE toxin-antitoxin system
MIGMNYKILPTKEFSKDFKKIDTQLKKRIRTKMQEVAKDPTRYKYLPYELAESCRIRIAKVRIIYSYDLSKQELYLEKIVLDHDYKN